MPLKTLLWLGFFGTMCVAALFSPVWGIIGYVGHYSIGPERQWWEAPLNWMGLRYSLMLAVCTAIGIALNWGKLRFGRSALDSQEKLMLLFLGLVWLIALVGSKTVGHYQSSQIDHPTVKLLKILIFVFMLTHVVTDAKKLQWLFWALVIGALILGMQAYSKPYGAFSKGRLEGVGGADFSDANRFGGYMAGMLFLVGVQFMRSGLPGKILAFLAGGFAANALVLTRSRGAFLGVLGGLVAAVLLAPRNYRAKIIAGVLIAALGGLYLSDPQFLHRIGTIDESQAQRDTSARSRTEIWSGGLKMLMDHPLGVGPGNFYQHIGEYAPNHAGRDAHNTFVRCAGELGFPGLIVLPPPPPRGPRDQRFPPVAQGDERVGMPAAPRRQSPVLGRLRGSDRAGGDALVRDDGHVGLHGILVVDVGAAGVPGPHAPDEPRGLRT